MFFNKFDKFDEVLKDLETRSSNALVSKALPAKIAVYSLNL